MVGGSRGRSGRAGPEEHRHREADGRGAGRAVTLVLDASAVVDLLIGAEAAATVQQHLEIAEDLVAPDLIYPEVTSAIWRLARSGEVTGSEADRAVTHLVSMPLDTVPTRPLVARAWGYRESVRIPDAFYLACAHELASPLLTSDARLHRGHHGVAVILAR
ncbi:MAG: PIN domain-containing protein [Acidimicrobiia bacterium]|nr:PIN domain-containing protein [Acidimicrobiia bacterium]